MPDERPKICKTCGQEESHKMHAFPVIISSAHEFVDRDKPETIMPCPFCGSSNVKVDHLVDIDDFFVSCGECEVQQIANYRRGVAIARWNQRVNHEK
jgi:Lar family restriction alleviation protein